MSLRWLLLVFPVGCSSGGGTDICGAMNSCRTPVGSRTPSTVSEALHHLPGRWLSCYTTGGGPGETIGIEFNQDVSQWWFLIDDGRGNPVKRAGIDSSGAVNLLVKDDALVEVDLFTQSQRLYPTVIALSGGPTPRLEIFGGQYILAPSGCGGALDGPFDQGSPTTSFGDECNSWPVAPNSCPLVGGVQCTFCAFLQLSATARCMQPCHRGQNDCPAGMSCVSLTDVSIAGWCADYDGYCM